MAIMMNSRCLKESANADWRFSKLLIRILLSGSRLTKWRRRLVHRISSYARDSKNHYTGSSKRQAALMGEGRQLLNKRRRDPYSLRSTTGSQAWSRALSGNQSRFFRYRTLLIHWNPTMVLSYPQPKSANTSKKNLVWAIARWAYWKALRWP